jgi:splicing factor 3B subunit 2
VDVSIDAAELEGLSEDQLRARYEAAAKGSAGVPGAGNREDFSDLVAKEMAKKKQKMEADRGRKGKEKEFKF